MKNIILLLALISCSSHNTPTYSDSVPTAVILGSSAEVGSSFKDHPGYERIKNRYGLAKVFVSKIVNNTGSDFPEKYFQDNLKFYLPNEFEYVSPRVSNSIIRGATFYEDGMVDRDTLESIKSKTAPDIIVYGEVQSVKNDDGSKEYYILITAFDAEKEIILVSIRNKLLVD